MQYRLLIWLSSLILTAFSSPIFAQDLRNQQKDEKHHKNEKENKDSGENKKTLKIGNLALPSSQQPGPLIGFGENIIDKGVVTYYLLADDFRGEKDKNSVEVIPSILHGITDNFSIFTNIPVAVRFQDKGHHSSGLEDIFVQFEYAFFSKEEKYFVDQATVVTDISFPSGSALKEPPTGFGTVNFFLGFTYNHTAIDWIYFTSYGATFSGSKHGTKISNEYLYQFGFGKNIGNLPGWIFTWLVELDGVYANRNRIRGKIDPNSGGNVIFITPSLWVSSEHLILQLGIGGAIAQKLYGKQNKNKFSLLLNLGWTF